MLKYPHYNIAVQFGFSYFFGSLSGTLDSTFGDYQSSLPRQTCAQHAPVYVPQPTAPLNPLLASLNPYPLPSGIDHKSQPSQPLTKCESVATSRLAGIVSEFISPVSAARVCVQVRVSELESRPQKSVHDHVFEDHCWCWWWWWWCRRCRNRCHCRSWSCSFSSPKSLGFLLWLPLKKASRWIVRLLTNCRGQNVYQL